MHEVIELDTDRKVGFPIRAELGRRTGRVTVPSVWIGERKFKNKQKDQRQTTSKTVTLTNCNVDKYSLNIV